MEIIGLINNTYDEYTVEWLIPNFSSFFAEDDKHYDSPTFSFIGAVMNFRINGTVNKIFESSRNLDIQLNRRSGDKISVDFSLSIKYSTEFFSGEAHYTHDFKEGDSWSTLRTISLSKTANPLTMVCSFKYPKSKECIVSDKLSSDFKTILLSGDHSDTIVKVETEEFRLHRSILAARNSYFDAMFKSDMKENTTGIITIHECDPNIFRFFIHFVYSGKVDKLSPESVCELYNVADKYQEDQLKEHCSKFMLNTMPIDYFCDYFILAFTHNEKELLQKCIEFFTTHGKEIIRSGKWQTLMKKYTVQANELLIKAFDYFIK